MFRAIENSNLSVVNILFSGMIAGGESVIAKISRGYNPLFSGCLRVIVLFFYKMTTYS